MVASDGGIFAFGDAAFHGSMGGVRLNAPVQSLVPDPDGSGYWLVASDGGVFAFDAGFRGSMGGRPLNRPVTGMVAYGDGYLMVAEDGGIFSFSNRAFVGSLASSPPAVPIHSVAALPAHR
jgi:ribosomal protein L24E